MKYLIIQGSSHHKVFVKCKRCKKEFSWLRAFEMKKDGEYSAICRKCRG